jgi:hypothetical protein
MTCAVSGSCGSAADFRDSAAGKSGSATPVQVTTASFWGVAIYTHPTSPGDAADIQITPNLSNAIWELSLTLSL